MKKLESFQTLIICILLHSCLVAVLSMGLDSYVISYDECNSERVSINQSLDAGDVSAVMPVTENNITLAIIRGIRNDSRTRTYTGNILHVIILVAFMSCLFSMNRKKCYFYDCPCIWGSYIIIILTFIHSIDGRKRFSSVC